MTNGNDRDLLNRFSAAGQLTKPATLPDSPSTTSPVESQQSLNTDVCFQHPDRPPKYYCQICHNCRCLECTRVFEGVAVCPDSDSLCITVEQYLNQFQMVVKPVRSYTEELVRALTFPFRHFIATTLIWLVACVTAAAIEAATDIANTPTLGKLLIGPAGGYISKTICYLFLGSIGMQYLINRINGRESLRFSANWEPNDTVEPMLLWLCAAIVGLSPLVIFTGFSQFQLVAVAIVTGNDYSKNLTPSATFFYYFKFFVFALWAVVVYPMAIVVAGQLRSLFQVFNPNAYLAAWRGLKGYLKPALGIAMAINFVAMLGYFQLAQRPFGLILTTLLLSVSTIISAIALGAAVEQGCDK